MRSWRAARQKSWAQAGHSEAQAEVKVEVPVRAGHRGPGGGGKNWLAGGKKRQAQAGGHTRGPTSRAPPLEEKLDASAKAGKSACSVKCCNGL